MKIFYVIFFLLCGSVINAPAQEQVKMEYSNEEVFIANPARLEMVENIAGKHHLLCFYTNEEPVLFLFNSRLEFEGKTSIPFILPERADIKIIPFASCYYLYVHYWNSLKYFVWKIDGEGNSTDLSLAFRKLLLSQSADALLGFQLTAGENGFNLLYHTDLNNTEKNTLVSVKTDSLFNVLFSNTVTYDFKKDEEILRQEILMFGKYLLILKTFINTTAMELLKVDIHTGAAIKNTFYSSGYLYRQPAVHFNTSDSSITLTALLTNLGGYSAKSYVFVSRLNKLLVEEVPFAILKSQFVKNTSTDFLLVDQSTQWIRFRSGYQQSSNYGLGNISLYQDYTMPDSNRLMSTIRSVNTTSEKYSEWNDGDPGIRFSLLDKNFTIINERRVANTKDSYTILPGQFTHFNVNDKAYMLVGQKFSRKFNGLLMVCSNKERQLLYTDVRVNTRKEYLLSKCRVIAKNSILMPYLYRRQAGLIKITIE